MPTSDNAVEEAHEAYAIANRKFLWWLAGVAYAIYCLFGHLLPRSIDDGFLIFLNQHGAAIVGSICIIFASVAFQQRKREQLRLRDVASAWAAEQTSSRGRTSTRPQEKK
jgi:undecaprenyl pyrophosphate phosphatase UppP